jgi:hypothetical protein
MEVVEISGERPELEREEVNRREPDLPPEYCHYRDEGCEFADSCLNCPFDQCLFDKPRGRQQWLKELRNKEIERLFTGGWGMKELAWMFGLSQRTIQRALKSTLAASTQKSNGNTDETEEIEKRRNQHR